MIERKLDKAGNVTGFWDTDKGKWAKPSDSFDVTTDESGKVIDKVIAQDKVDKRQEQVDQALAEADPVRAQEAHDEAVATAEEEEEEVAEEGEDGEVIEDKGTDPDSLSKDELISALNKAGVVPPKNSSKLQLVELYHRTFGTAEV